MNPFAEAEQLVRQGQLAPAAQLLEEALGTAGEASPALWLQLAGLRRALRQPRRALDAVHRALSLSPLDFMALTMRAGLLERLEDPRAGEAWGEALAQRPQGDLAPPLAAAIEAGEQVHAAWLAKREARLIAAAAQAQAAASPEEARRIARFRDNVLRKTRHFHSEPSHFHYPGLAEREFHPREHFPWLAELEAATDNVRGEMQALLASQRAEIEPYLQYEEHEALAQFRALNRNPDWNAIHLYRQGERIAANADACPATMALLDRLPQHKARGATPNAMFSLLAPHTTIPPHTGVDNTRLLCHLPLIVPEGGCAFRVGAETRLWREGEAFVFDDSIEHEAVNPTGLLRVVMIFDIWHPDLGEAERAGVAATIGAQAGA